MWSTSSSAGRLVIKLKLGSWSTDYEAAASTLDRSPIGLYPYKDYILLCFGVYFEVPILVFFYFSVVTAFGERETGSSRSTRLD